MIGSRSLIGLGLGFVRPLVKFEDFNLINASEAVQQPGKERTHVVYQAAVNSHH